MEKYDVLFHTAVQTLHQFDYAESSIRFHERCYREFKTYLVNTGASYSPELANEWYFSIQSSLSTASVSAFHAALVKLRDIYFYGHVLTEHININHYRYLSDTDKQVVDAYRNGLSSTLTDLVSAKYRKIVAGFLYFAEAMNCVDYTELSYEVIRAFYSRPTEKLPYAKQNEDRIVYHFLLWMYDHSFCAYGFSITLHYLLTNGNPSWLNVSADALSRMEALNENSSVSPDTLPHCIETITATLEALNYQRSSITCYRRILEMLFLFLDEKNLNYSFEIASLWLTNSEITDSSNINRRAIRLLDNEINGVETDYTKVYRHKPAKVKRLPDWCRSIVIQFLDMKRNEGMKNSTVSMYGCSIASFCNYLASQGIAALSDIVAEDIKSFHRQDIHRTPEGKNAYNTRIRKFLKWLGEEGIIPNPFLYLSVPCKSVNREYVVVILTDEEKAQLHDKLKSDDLSLRDKAMLLLGYRLGIRGTDITSLEISDVDWESYTIRFIQNKTGVELVLPLTPDVGNAIFKYIMDERPDSKESKIFIRERAPFSSLTRNVCRKTMKRAFPDRNVPGSDFHVLRKTRSTDLLRNGASMQTVTDFLGHRNNSTVMKYLSLDEERMRKCAISLKESSLEFCGGINDA